TAASKSADIQIVDPARVPDFPIRPRPLLNLGLGLLAGLIGGIGLAFICEELDNKLRSPDDIRRWIGSANVSVIPAITEPASREGRLGWPKQIVGDLPVPAE